MKSAIHDASIDHVTGKSHFVDDRTFLDGEVQVGVVYSKMAHAKILSLSFEKCKNIEGYLGSFTHKDIQNNSWGSIFHDQPVLAKDKVQFVGEPIALVVANTKEALEQAREAVVVKMEPLHPVLDLRESIRTELFIGPNRSIETGNPEEEFKKSDHQIESEIEIAGQDHFYLESQCAIAYPKEGQQIEIHSSSQHPTEIQHCVAEALGLQFHQVVCIVTRMGGAFGGKESQAAPFAVFAALATQRFGKAARIVITKDDDMVMTGKRNPFLIQYKVGFDTSGKIQSLIAVLSSDGGAYADLSTAIMERAMLHIDNAYYIPNLSICGQVYKTNTSPNTAFRGFGGPKGVLAIEKIIEEIARHLKIDALDVRKENVYVKGNQTHYDQEIEDNILPNLFSQLEESGEYRTRRQEIDEINSKSPEEIHGLSMTAVKFGISFTTRFLNQGSALVNLHMDGTVQVSTGATEMGQGVNTKISQVVAEEFGIPTSWVKVMPTSTEKNANTSATAASSGSDINGRAALAATLKIKERLQKTAVLVFQRSKELRGRAIAGAGTVPELDIESVKNFDHIQFKDTQVFDEKNKQEMKFVELLEEAYLNRIPLTDNGFYRYPGIFFDKVKGKGNAFYYYTNGVALSEVSLNRYTGELKVLRTDILMDLGRPLNHQIDMGQVTGAFVQGMGWLTTENLYYNSRGQLLSHSPSTYKIPSIQDIPRDFNCKLLENTVNHKNLKGSKAVGEPPLLLSISVWTAALDALKNISDESQTRSLSVPATQEKLLLRIRDLDA